MPAHPPQKACPLKQFYIVLVIQAIFAGGALGTGEAETFPGANDRRGNADQAGRRLQFSDRVGRSVFFIGVKAAI